MQSYINIFEGCIPKVIEFAAAIGRSVIGPLGVGGGGRQAHLSKRWKWQAASYCK